MSLSGIGMYRIFRAMLPSHRAAVSLVVLLLLNLVVASHAAEPYRIGAGDLLSIVVYGEPDLSLNQVRVGTEGMVSYPLLGEIKVGGLALADVEKKVTTLLLDGYLKKPKVSVSILEYRMFYMTGQIKRPGGYNFVEGLTVRKAIALAGGFTMRGSKRKMTKIAENAEAATNVNMNSPVGPGDIITIGETFF